MCATRAGTRMFSNGMAYARYGEGSKTLLALPGGPGNVVPSGFMLRMMLRHLRPLIEADYTVWYVTRRQNMPTGYTVADMADDYGSLITGQFDGKVDLVVGDSFGGMIGIYLAANHPDLFDYIALVGVAYEASDSSKQQNYQFALRLSEGKPELAMTESLRADFPDWTFPGADLILDGAAALSGGIMGRWAFRNPHPHFSSDVMVEAEAGVAFDARRVLSSISVPILLIAGDKDEDFPQQLVVETARLIPECELKLYRGKNHTQTFLDVKTGRDILAFTRRTVTKPHRDT